MTLVQALRELREISGGEYCSIKVDVTATHCGNEEIGACWYVHGYEWSETFASLLACLEDARAKVKPAATTKIAPEQDVAVF